MIKRSIVPEILNTYKMVFTDSNYIPIKICEKTSQRISELKIKNPFLVINNLEKANFLDVQIERMNYDQLNKLGFNIIAVKCKSNMRNYRMQKKSYLIEHMSDQISGGEILIKVPIDHFLERDILNDRIRLKGKNAFPYNRRENASHWVWLEKSENGDI